jgi:tetratricopeptide (TPR) repeat protein
MLRSLIEKQPDAQAWAYRLATALLRSAMLANATGRMDDAERLVAESIRRLDALTAIEPDNRVWTRDLAHALLEGGEIARLRGDAQASRARLEQALARSSALRAKGETLLEWRRMDALIRVRLATSGPPVEFDRPVAELRGLAQANPSDPGSRNVLASALIARGIAHDRLHSTDAARSDWREALSWLAPVAQLRNDPLVVSLRVQAHTLLGEHRRAEADIAWLRRIGHRLPGEVVRDPAGGPREGASPAPD